MSVTLTTLVPLIRYLLGEQSKSKSSPGDIFTYTSSAVFTLIESNVIGITEVLINDSTSGITYSYNDATNKLTILTPTLTSGDTVEVIYTYYPNYSTSELQNYIRAAVLHLSLNNYYDFDVESSGEIYPEPTVREGNLIAFLAATLIEPGNTTVRFPDMTINVPNSLSTEDLVRKAIAIFKHNSSGLWAIS